MHTRSARSLLALVVFTHAAVTIFHGAAHAGAQVFLGLAGNAFVLLVIEAGPLVGLWLSRSRPTAGGWLVAATMAGALVFGVANHLMIAGPDHVAHVASEWRPLFATTAALLVVTEVAGTAAGVWLAFGRPLSRQRRFGEPGKEWSS
jgi:hypothetical protein